MFPMTQDSTQLCNKWKQIYWTIFYFAAYIFLEIFMPFGFGKFSIVFKIFFLMHSKMLFSEIYDKCTFY